jgi:dipeptidyl aminopeptidase/acylaminoacyl peptidase
VVQIERVELEGGAVRLPAQLCRPDTEGMLPAVLVVPGGTEQGVVSSVDWVATRLAEAGYIALTVTYRARQPVHDPEDAILGLDWLERQPGVDRNRIGIFGHSRGGLTAWRVAAQEARVRSVVSFAAPSDIGQAVRTVAEYAPSRYQVLVDFMGGTPDEQPDRYALVRGLSYAGRIHQPVLLVQGTMDMITPVEHSIRMEQALKEAGNPQVRLELIDRMGHFCELTGQGYLFDRVAGLATEWFRSTLG